MGEQEKIETWQKKIQAKFSKPHIIRDYIVHTMTQFAYRYIENSTEDEMEFDHIKDQGMEVLGKEYNMGMALKVSNSRAKGLVKELAKTYPPKEKPFVLNRLRILWPNGLEESGKLKLIAQMDYGFPQFESPEKIISQERDFIYSDVQEFRKNLALELEEICDLFL